MAQTKRTRGNPASGMTDAQRAAVQRLRQIARDGAPEMLVDLDEAPEARLVERAAIEMHEDPPPRVSLEVRRIAEAILFASAEPVSRQRLAEQLPDGCDVDAVLASLQEDYAERGFQLVRVAGKWVFRTADDLSYLLEKHTVDERRLSKAALETLAIIAYHQPVTRAEIEEIRGVATSRGTLDVLMETSWVRPRGRRRAPGKPVTYGTTEAFLVHFGLNSLSELPGLAELKGAGLLDNNLPPDFVIPGPKEIAALMPDELPLEEDEVEHASQGELELNDEEGDLAEDEEQGSPE